MPHVQTKTYFEKQLPKRLAEALYKIAQKYDRKGVTLFIFGSFARDGANKTSDLDLGMLWKEKRNSRISTELYRDIRRLPTIRKIDLVDMEQVDQAFKKKVLSQDILVLTDDTIKKGEA